MYSPTSTEPNHSETLAGLGEEASAAHGEILEGGVAARMAASMVAASANGVPLSRAIAASGA